MKIFRKAFFNIPVPAPMEVKGDLLSNSTFFKDQWENYKVTTGLRDKSRINQECKGCKFKICYR